MNNQPNTESKDNEEQQQSVFIKLMKLQEQRQRALMNQLSFQQKQLSLQQEGIQALVEDQQTMFQSVSGILNQQQQQINTIQVVQQTKQPLKLPKTEQPLALPAPPSPSTVSRPISPSSVVNENKPKEIRRLRRDNSISSRSNQPEESTSTSKPPPHPSPDTNTALTLYDAAVHETPPHANNKAPDTNDLDNKPPPPKDNDDPYQNIHNRKINNRPRQNNNIDIERDIFQPHIRVQQGFTAQKISNMQRQRTLKTLLGDENMVKGVHIVYAAGKMILRRLCAEYNIENLETDWNKLSPQIQLSGQNALELELAAQGIPIIRCHDQWFAKQTMEHAWRNGLKEQQSQNHEDDSSKNEPMATSAPSAPSSPKPTSSSSIQRHHRPSSSSKRQRL